ncbi:MAG: hypothetical protein HY678_08580 [Chloroflexi bacterium]|nr:hypothetical protein [Chloroflexota bacterium]
MNADYGLDLAAVMHHVQNAKIFSIFFPALRKALVVDMRQGAEEGPMIRVLPMARSPHERLRGLKRLRPHLPRATEIVAIPWPIYVENLVRSGVWDKMATRIADSGYEDAVRSLNSSLQELRRLERQELAALIRGDQYETIWSKDEPAE